MGTKIPTVEDTIVSTYGRYFGADDRTRTCTLARWNLNPMSLPIPPHPHIPDILSRGFFLVNGKSTAVSGWIVEILIVF